MFWVFWHYTEYTINDAIRFIIGLYDAITVSRK